MAKNDRYWLDQMSKGNLKILSNGAVLNKGTGNVCKGGGSRYCNLWYRDPIDKSVRHVGVHRLVALNKYGPIPEMWTVNHLDGNRRNNHPDNLEIGPHSANIRHSYENGLQPPPPKGENRWGSKLTDAQVKDIRQSSDTCRETAAIYGVSYSLVSMIRRRERRT